MLFLLEALNFLGYECVLVMSDLRRAGLAEDDGDHVEAIGPVVDFVGGKKIPGRPERSGFL